MNGKKLVILAGLVLLGVFAAYAQNIPAWVRVGMSKADITKNLDGASLKPLEAEHQYSCTAKNGEIYDFNIDPADGLQIFSVKGNSPDFEFNKLTSSFAGKYGQPAKRTSYMYYFRNNLPRDVEMILVHGSSDYTTVIYYLTGSF